MWSSLIPRWLTYAIIACRPGPSPCGREFDDNEQRKVIVHCLVASCCERRGTCVVWDYENGGEQRGAVIVAYLGAGDCARRSRVLVTVREWRALATNTIYSP